MFGVLLIVQSAVAGILTAGGAGAIAADIGLQVWTVLQQGPVILRALVQDIIAKVAVEENISSCLDSIHYNSISILAGMFGRCPLSRQGW